MDIRRTFSFTMVLLLACGGIPGAMATHLTPVQDGLQAAEDAACTAAGEPDSDCEDTATDGLQSGLTAADQAAEDALSNLPDGDDVTENVTALITLLGDILASLPDQDDIEENVTALLTLVGETLSDLPDQGDIDENVTALLILVDSIIDSLPDQDDIEDEVGPLPSAPAEVVIAPRLGVVVQQPSTAFAYGVVLTSDPLGTLTIDITPSSGIETSEDTLTFDSDNWFMPQVVLVTPVGLPSALLTLENVHHGVSVASGPFGEGPLDSVAVVKAADQGTADVVRDALAPVLTSAVALPSSLEIHETGTEAQSSEASYALFLTSPPSAEVTVAAFVDDPSEATVASDTGNEVVFSGSNWFVPQTFAVAAVSDQIDEGESFTTGVSHRFTSADPYYDDLGGSGPLGSDASPVVDLIIIDDDFAGFTIVQTDDETTVSETGATTDTFTVALDSQPTGDVTLGLSDGATDEYTLDVISLSFDASNWGTPQTVTVTAVHDEVDDGDQSQSLTISVDTAPTDYAGVADAVVNVNVLDVDIAAVLLSATSLTMDEAAGFGTFDVRLDSKPSAPVTLDVGSDTGEAITSVTSLTFTDADWFTPQTVTVTAVPDDIDRDDTSEVSVAVGTPAASEYTGLASQVVALTLTNDDTAGVTVTGGPFSLDETTPGTTADFTVVLDSEPTADVTVDIASTLGQVSFDKTSLTFTADDWDTAVTVTVSVIDDTVDEGAHGDTVTVTVAPGSASEYDSLAGSSLVANILDNDVANLVLSTPSLTVAEGGAGNPFTVALATQPTDDVTVALAVDDASEASVSSASLTFTAADWDTPQTVTVTGLEDNLDDGDQTVTVTATPSGDGYAVVASAVVDVTVTDVDTVQVTIQGPVAVEEGGTATFTAALSVPSVASVTFDYSTTEGTATAADFDATGGNIVVPIGSMSVTFTVNAFEDALDEDEETFTVTIANVGGGNGGTAVAGAVVEHVLSIVDNDLAPKVAFATPLDTTNPTEGNESQNIILTIELSEVSGRDVTIGVYLAGGTAGRDDLTLNADDMLEGVLFLTGDTPVTIPAGELSAMLEVTVTDDEADEQDETALFGLRNPTNAGIGSDNSFGYTILDDDGPTVGFVAASSTGSEGKRLVKVEVTLDEASVQDVVVDFTVAGTAVAPGDHDLAAGQVTFAAGQVSKVISFLVEDDGLAESAETVEITLVAADNATLGADTHIYTIVDND